MAEINIECHTDIDSVCENFHLNNLIVQIFSVFVKNHIGSP